MGYEALENTEKPVHIFSSLALRPDPGTFGEGLCQVGTSLYVSDGTLWTTIVAGSGNALTTNPLSQFAATSSAQLKGVLSDETGSGLAVFNTSPTLVTPVLGTPTSGVLTNCTGTASGLTAGNVTTNANLTGHVTSSGNAAVLGVFSSAQLKTALSDETGSGLAVFNTSPVLVTPALGVPTSGDLSYCSGTAPGLTAGAVTTNANLTGHITSSGNAAVLGVFNSAQLSAAISDETGSGLAVFNTSPVFVTPALGTPASGVITSCTGSPTLTAPLLGTPASGVLTNCTGTAAGLTAGTVTTNANLTGHITSSGNAAVLGVFSSAQLKTALSDETGTGGGAVFATSPVLTTPILSTAHSGLLIGAGASGATHALGATADNGLEFYLDATHTTGDMRGEYLRLYFSGAGGCGEALRAVGTINGVSVGAGGTVNGAHISLTSTGAGAKVAGQANALRVTFGAAASVALGGTCAALLVDTDFDNGATVPTNFAFIRCTDVNSKKAVNLMRIPDAAAGAVLATHTVQGLTHSIKIISEDGTPYYIMCTDAATNRAA